MEIVLWGNHNEDNGDTISFGTQNFCIALQNLIYAPKLVVCIDIVKTRIEDQDEHPGSTTLAFCAFDWLLATFSNEWFFGKTYFDLFRAVARFHMNRMFPDKRFQTCQSRWFREARASTYLTEHEHTRWWELEDRYGLPHEEYEEYEEWPGASNNDGTT